MPGNTEITPPDTRYVPIPQQPYCCVPANLSMIMLRLGIPLLPQELIGHHLGLVVPTARKNEFWNVRHAEQPAVASGFGTQIQNKEKFGMQKALDFLNIPLTFEHVLPSQIKSQEDLAARIQKILVANEDVMLCLDCGTLDDQPEKRWGHLLTVDLMTGDTVRLMETDIGCKWKSFPVGKAYKAIQVHGDSNYGGLWIFRKKK